MAFFIFFPLFYTIFGKLALTLLMALVLGANHHHFAVSFDDFALVAHGLYRRSDFHVCFSLLYVLRYWFKRSIVTTYYAM